MLTDKTIKNMAEYKVTSHILNTKKKITVFVNFLKKITRTEHTTKASQEERDYFVSWTIVAIVARIILAPGLRVQSIVIIVQK